MLLEHLFMEVDSETWNGLKLLYINMYNIIDFIINCNIVNTIIINYSVE